MKKCFLVVCTCFATVVYSQVKVKFVKGFVITTSGDRREGLIKDEAVKDINRRVVFKQFTESKEETLLPENVKKIDLETGEKYERFSYIINGEEQKKVTLARALLKSELSLYECYDDGEQMFLLVKDTVVFLLKDDAIESGSTEMKKYFFKEMLGAMVAECAGLTQRCEKIEFDEAAIKAIVKAYNKCKNSTIEEQLDKKVPSVKHLILFVGGMSSGAESEIAVAANYRIYFPKLGKGTSLNISTNYFKGNESFRDLDLKEKEAEYSIIMASLYGQQNFLNENFRPYAMLGFSVGYVNVNFVQAIAQPPKGLQKNYGIGFLFGAGTECNIFKGLMLRAEYRFDLVSHLTAGIAFNFLHKK